MTASTLADTCPECLPGDHPAILPHAVTDDGQDGLMADYQCQACGHRWRCGWDARSAGRTAPAREDSAA